MGYQSQPLLIFLLLLGFIGIYESSPRWLIIGGIASGFSLLTNMTSAPYVIISLLWVLLRRRSLGLYFAVPAILIPVAGIAIGEWITGAYISNVFLNQAGAFPRADVLSQYGQTPAGYALQKLRTQGTEIIRLEGSFTLVGILGLLLAGTKIRDLRREYLLWYSLASIGCILYLAKGGTVDYVYSVAEPYIAIGAGMSIFWIAARWLKPSFGRVRTLDTTPIATLGLLLFLSVSLLWPAVGFSYRTLMQRTYEMNEAETMRFVGLIKRYCPPDGLIIAPPHMAFIAQRHIAADYSEHFLWRVKYMNERLDKSPGKGVATIKRIAALLNQKKINFLVLDMNQTGQIPEIKAAVAANYEPLLDKIYETQLGDTPLQLYKPK
jgi:hypothetical protein